MELYLNISLALLTLLGGLLPLIFKKWKNDFAPYVTAFSGAYLLTISLSHLLPEAFHHNTISRVGVWVVIGYFGQYLLQHITHGAEHGHQCNHHHNVKSAWTLFIGMFIHSFVEGLPLSSGFFSISTLIPLYIAIVLHKLPSAMIISDMFMHSGKSRNYVILLAIVFSLVTPIGAYTGKLFINQVNGFENIIGYIVPIVAGSFLQIATTIFSEISNTHQHISKIKWILLCSGVILGCISTFMHIH